MQLNLDEIRAIAELVRKKGLDGIVVESTDAEAPPCRLELRREVVVTTAPETITPIAPAPQTAEVSAKDDVDDTIFITSPAVGIFRHQEDGLTENDEVQNTQVVGIVESLKIPTDVSSAAHGIITEVLVKNGQGVEYGQPLIAIRPI